MQLQAILTLHDTESVLTALRTLKILRLERYKQYSLYGFEMMHQNAC